MDRRNAGLRARGTAALPAEGKVAPAGRGRRTPALPEEALGFQLRIASEAMRAAMQQQFERHGIRLAHWSYLRILWLGDGMLQHELSSRVRRVGANTVSTLNALERMGLVRRERSATDRRNVHVYLTEAGWNLEKVLVPVAKDVQRRALAGIPEAQVQTIRRVLRAIMENLAD